MNSFILFLFLILNYSTSKAQTDYTQGSGVYGWCDETNYGNAIYRELTLGEYYSREKNPDHPDTHEEPDYWACSFQDAYNDRFRGYVITHNVTIDDKSWDHFQMYD